MPDGGDRPAQVEQETEHPHDTEDLVRLVTLIRTEQGWTKTRLSDATGVPESEISRFEAAEIVPAKPMAMRLLEGMGSIEPGLF
ncbi:Helix-turn-helix [Saccharopolyspora kobensis]|uniref:Helix-turn-helix n=1 Tax=Saccharopolyspora kobensis TaxID=146035 RepID=A0A1H5WRC5_9PSEU|nr:helix-turn-helix transcriptional regulator [Saccharopolyspora kobensis]SEG01938.1 Helix-turn-helix [Saccharopolyspora kobensis]SFD78680.1 Helix-turn-helix [Saccharopolyspora kobensis]